MLRPLVLVLSLSPLNARAADINFCWVGADGYTMTGRMDIPDDRMDRAVVTQADVTQFKIAGYHKGALLGTWDAKQVRDDTTWHLRFNPSTTTFLTGGTFSGSHSQGWNADGNVENCGNPGFGFNSGNYAQDICVNGTYVHASSIAPDTPFVATTGPVTPDCRDTIRTSKSSQNESGD